MVVAADTRKRPPPRCGGDGTCLVRTSTGWERRPGCEAECVPWRCAGFESHGCATLEPEWVLRFNGGLCVTCRYLGPAWRAVVRREVDHFTGPK